jgi:hypothetical protein
MFLKANTSISSVSCSHVTALLSSVIPSPHAVALHKLDPTPCLTAFVCVLIALPCTDELLLHLSCVPHCVQVDEFIEECINPILEKHASQLAVENADDVNV